MSSMAEYKNYLLEKLNKYSSKQISECTLDYLYNYYNDCLNRLSDFKNKKITNNVSKEDFYKYFSIVYNQLKYKISEEEFKDIGKDYLKLIIADHFDECNVDIIWFIKYIWYFTAITDKKITKKYEKTLPLIQEKLIEEFNVQESFYKRIQRKIYTKSLV